MTFKFSLVRKTTSLKFQVYDKTLAFVMFFFFFFFKFSYSHILLTIRTNSGADIFEQKSFYLRLKQNTMAWSFIFRSAVLSDTQGCVESDGSAMTSP